MVVAVLVQVLPQQWLHLALLANPGVAAGDPQLEEDVVRSVEGVGPHLTALTEVVVRAVAVGEGRGSQWCVLSQ